MVCGLYVFLRLTFEFGVFNFVLQVISLDFLSSWFKVGCLSILSQVLSFFSSGFSVVRSDKKSAFLAKMILAS